MARREVWLGSEGPYIYDDQEVPEGEDIPFAGLRTTGAFIMQRTRNPTGIEDKFLFYREDTDPTEIFAEIFAQVDLDGTTSIQIIDTIGGAGTLDEIIFKAQDRISLEAVEVEINGANYHYTLVGVDDDDFTQIGDFVNLEDPIKVTVTCPNGLMAIHFVTFTSGSLQWNGVSTQNTGITQDTGVPTGTSGVDGEATLFYDNANQDIYIENRTGDRLNFYYQLLSVT